MKLRLSQKGWIVIPAALRKKYNLKAGDLVQIVDYGGVFGIVPIDLIRFVQVRDCCAAKIR